MGGERDARGDGGTVRGDVYDDELQFGESGVLPVGPAVESDRTVPMPVDRSGQPYAVGQPYAIGQPHATAGPSAGREALSNSPAEQGGRKLTKIAVALVIVAALLVAGSVAFEYAQSALRDLSAPWGSQQSSSQADQPSNQPLDQQTLPPASDAMPADAAQAGPTGTDDRSSAHAEVGVVDSPVQPSSPVGAGAPDNPAAPDAPDAPSASDAAGNQPDAGTTVTGPSDALEPAGPDVPDAPSDTDSGAASDPGSGADSDAGSGQSAGAPDDPDGPGVTVTPPNP